MVIIHIAHIDPTILGGVQVAVPQMIRSQSQYATVGLMNTFNSSIADVHMLPYNEHLQFTPPFNDPDLIVFHEVYHPKFIKLYKMAQHIGIPYIVVPHGCLSEQAQKRKRFKKIIGNYCFFNSYIASSKAIQYLSKNERDMSIFKDKCCLISGNGITLPSQYKSVFSKTNVLFTYIGRLEVRTKGLDLLINAVAECQNLMRTHNAQVAIYGPDTLNERRELISLIEATNIADIIKLYGPVTGTKKREILLSSDCFLQTSRTEGLPMGTIEAMSYGIPCIATQGVGLGNLISSYGAGVSCETSAYGIASAIRTFLESSDKWESMSLAAHVLAKENFDSCKIAKYAIEEYAHIAKS